MKCRGTIQLKAGLSQLFFICLFLFPFVFLQHIVSAQQVLFRNYSVNDGLSSNTVWNIVQDDQGYMWFGTKNGLNRFDGHTFKVYQARSAAATTAGNSFIHSICRYGPAHFWVGTEDGLYILDLVKEQFSKVHALGDDLVFSILKDDKGTMWIGTRSNGLYRYDASKNHFFNYRKGAAVRAISHNQIRRLQQDSDGNIWIGTFGEGIDILDPETGQVRNVKAGATDQHISSNFVLTLYKDLSGNIWIGTLAGGLNCWKKDDGKFKVYKTGGQNAISDNIVRAIYQPDPTKLYVGTEKGLNLLDIASDQFKYYASNSSDPYSISDNAVYSIYPDREGGIWVGTYFGGVNYFSEAGPGFNFYYQTGAADGLSGKAVSCFLEDKPGYYWVGTENGGLNYFDSHTGKFKKYPFTAQQEKLSYSNIHALYKDKDENLWVGTFSGGLNIINLKTGKIKRYTSVAADPSSLSSNSVYTINEDRKGNIWVGTVKGLNLYNKEADNFTRITGMDLQNSCIYEVYEDRAGVIWVATYEHGVVYRKANQHSWARFSTDNSDISSNRVIALHDDGLGNLWVGTDGGGLNKLDRKTQRFTSFMGRAGMASVVFGILQDRANRLWLSTNDGILKFSEKPFGILSFANSGNFNNRLYNYNAYYKGDDGRMLMGGINGFSTFYPGQLKLSTDQNNVVLTNFKLFNKEVSFSNDDAPLNQSPGYARDITLRHNQSVISFEYAALNYKDPDRIQYAYQMEGFDNGWNMVGVQRNATYTNLPPGNYTFKVKATDVYGNWNESTASIVLVVKPPFYRTTVAYIFYIIALALGIWLLKNYFKRREQAKNAMKLERMKAQKEHEFYQQKIDFFTTMAHEIRTPLSLIMAPLEKLLTEENKPETVLQLNVMEQNTQRLLTLVNQLLDFRRIESDIYTIKKERLELVTFIHALYSRFSTIASQKGIRFNMSTDVNQLHINADGEALQKILSNLFINAFKFARSFVEIKISLPPGIEDQKVVAVSVSDDGVGIPQSELQHVFTPFFKVSSPEHKIKNIGGTGIGLSLAKALAEKHEGALDVHSRPGTPTIFTLSIPFEPKAANAAPASETEDSEDAARPGILIVEDDLNMLDFIVTNFRGEGYQTFSATNGLEALKVLEAHPVELVISDVMMPEMDGMSLCKKIKNSIHFSHIPVILLTAKGNSDAELQGIESGADAYVVKPFKWKHITALVRNLLETRLRLKEKFNQQPLADIGTITTNTHDKKFIETITGIVEKRIDDYRLSVEELSREMSMSRSTLHKKVKAVTGHVPNEFIRLVRLRMAAKLLISGEYNISEVGYKTGFNSPSYFSRCFIQQFKLTPSEFLDKYQNGALNDADDLLIKEQGKNK
ncbi:hybrid sensor histidine kinase/response regulator transcription factor [Niabella insulamsoli]|uniref:hybrid sensor histidine kinase/response regulator transcription factor n=1 Tax=Niabella insulamsoli TaxID=3144874 RepID=UPI0031FC167F